MENTDAGNKSKPIHSYNGEVSDFIAQGIPQFIGFEAERLMLTILARNEDLIEAPGMGPHLFGDATNQLIYQTLADYIQYESHPYTKGHVMAYARQVPGLWEKIDADERFVPLFDDSPHNIDRSEFNFMLGRLRQYLAHRMAFIENWASIQSLLSSKDREGNPADGFRQIALKIETLAPCGSISVLNGTDPITYSEMELDMSLVLAGDRWLSRKTAAMLVAPSGHGKSTFTTQLVLGWACGRPVFGINSAGALQIVCIQAEDDKNDVIEFCRMERRMNLSDAEKALIRKNAHIEQVADCTGPAFFKRIRTILSARRSTDVLIINPLTAYLGKDPRDPTSNADFFRVRLAQILAEFNCACIIVHHTPKTNFIRTEDFNWWDWMYLASGEAGIVNWIRACLVMWPTSQRGTYRFIAAKRGARIGWTEMEYYFSWSEENGICLWVPSTSDQIKSAQESKEGRSSAQTKEKHKHGILALVPKIDPISQERLFQAAKCGQKLVRQIIAVLIEDGKVFEHKMLRYDQSGKRLKSGVGYSQMPPTLEEETTK
jgi:hypothetical protein